MKIIYKLSAVICVGFMTVSCASYTKWISEYQDYEPYRSSSNSSSWYEDSLYSGEDLYCPDNMRSNNRRRQQPKPESFNFSSLPTDSTSRPPNVRSSRVESKVGKVKSGIEKIISINSGFSSIKTPNKGR